MTEAQKDWLRSHHSAHPLKKQADLIEAFHGQFGFRPSQPAVSRALKAARETDHIQNTSVKKVKSVEYPRMENALYEWFLAYQEKVRAQGLTHRRQSGMAVIPIQSTCTDRSTLVVK